MIAIVDINRNMLDSAMMYLNEKRYGIGKDSKELLLDLKRKVIIKKIMESCSEDKLNNKIRILIEKYN